MFLSFPIAWVAPNPGQGKITAIPGTVDGVANLPTKRAWRPVGFFHCRLRAPGTARLEMEGFLMDDSNNAFVGAFLEGGFHLVQMKRLLAISTFVQTGLTELSVAASDALTAEGDRTRPDRQLVSLFCDLAYGMTPSYFPAEYRSQKLSQLWDIQTRPISRDNMDLLSLEDDEILAGARRYALRVKLIADRYKNLLTNWSDSWNVCQCMFAAARIADPDVHDELAMYEKQIDAVRQPAFLLVLFARCTDDAGRFFTNEQQAGILAGNLAARDIFESRSNDLAERAETPPVESADIDSVTRNTRWSKFREMAEESGEIPPAGSEERTSFAEAVMHKYNSSCHGHGGPKITRSKALEVLRALDKKSTQ